MPSGWGVIFLPVTHHHIPPQQSWQAVLTFQLCCLLICRAAPTLLTLTKLQLNEWNARGIAHIALLRQLVIDGKPHSGSWRKKNAGKKWTIFLCCSNAPLHLVPFPSHFINFVCVLLFSVFCRDLKSTWMCSKRNWSVWRYYFSLIFLSFYVLLVRSSFPKVHTTQTQAGPDLKRALNCKTISKKKN